MATPAATLNPSQGTQPRTIGILTSGGDCAGLNAVIRAVVARAVLGYGWRVYGIRHGTMGVLRRPLEFEELDLRISTVNILRLGGTILGTTNRGDPFAFPMPDGTLRDRSAEVIEGVRMLGIDALIGIGLFLSQHRWHLIAWCRLRQDYRDFRADRIKSMRVLEDTFSRERRMSLQEYLEAQKSQPDDMQHLVIIHMRKDVAQHMQTIKLHHGLLTEAPIEDGFEMTFLVGCLEHFAGWMMTCGRGVKIISPVELTQVVRKRVLELQDHHGMA